MSDRRWLDEGAPDEVRRLLESAVIDEPSPERLASLRAKVGPLFDVPPGSAPPATGGAAAGAGLAAKVLGGVALLTLGVGGGLWLGRSGEAPVLPPPPVVAPAPVAVVPPPAPDVVAPPPTPAPVARPAPVKRVEAPPPPAPQPPTKSSADEELELLQAAMAAPTPVESLALVDQHVARFPESSLAQEREVLAVKALMQQGRVDDAKERAAAFKRRWPTSPHLLRVESLIAK